jgi:hypothetical protein
VNKRHPHGVGRVLYGIASSARSGDIEDWYPTREETLRRRSPSSSETSQALRGELWVEAVELEQSAN